MQTKTKYDAADLTELAIAVALATHDPEYRPTLFDARMADAFDAAMGVLSRPQRAWRGSRAEAR